MRTMRGGRIVRPLNVTLDPLPTEDVGLHLGKREKPSAKPPRLPWTVRHAAPNVTVIECSTDSVSGWELWGLLRFDAHHDSALCDQKLERKHLEEAKERGAFIIDGGDLFDAMQGREDKRRASDTLRNENKRTAYSDSLVDEAAKFYAPYARNFAVMTPGNHESAFMLRYGTDLTQRLVGVLNHDTGSNIQCGWYDHWCRVSIKRQSQRASRTIWWTHGGGSGAPVTLGTIQGQRSRAIIEGADLMLSGHDHNSVTLDVVKVRLNGNNREELRPLFQVMIPTYLDDYQQRVGWSKEKRHPPKPKGAYWVRFWMHGHNAPLDMEVLRAR